MIKEDRFKEILVDSGGFTENFMAIYTISQIKTKFMNT